MDNIKSKLFRKYIFSYTIMLCLPICIFCVTVYFSVKSDMRQKSITRYQNEAVQISNQLDNIFTQYTKIRDDLLTSSWVTRFMSNTDVFDSEFSVVKRNEICRELMIFKSIYSGIDNVAVYFPRKDTVFDQIGWFTMHSYMKRLNIRSISFEYFQTTVQNTGNFDYFDISAITDNSYDAFVITQKLELANNPRAILILYINRKYLDSYIDSISSNLLVGYSIAGIDGLILEKNNSGEIDEEKFHRVDYQSDKNSIEYSFIYKIDTASPSFEALYSVIIAIIISLITGSMIAYSFAYVNYTPVRNIVRKIFSGVGTPNRAEEHEYLFIDKTFDTLFTEKKQMQMQVIRYQNAARSDMMKRLLAGYFERDNLGFKMKEIGLDYTDELYYLVMLVERETHSNKVEYKNSDMFALYNAVDKILRNMETSYQIVVSVDGSIIIVIDFEEGSLDHKICDEFSEELSHEKSALSFTPKIFFGSMEKGIVGISKSFQKAKEDQSNFRLKSNIVQTNLLINKGMTYYYPTDWEIQLINKTKIGDYDTAKKILDEIRLENEKRSYEEAAIIKLTTDIINTLTRVLQELNVDVMDLDEQNQELSMLQETENVQLLWDFTYLVCSKICDRTNIRNTEDNDICMARQIIDYINNNITDSMLSLKNLSDKFNLSASSISKMFKENMGINFYDYICRIRMDKAKEMLCIKKYSIPKIAKAVGYENDYSFKRAFVRYEGVKPEEYRKIIVSSRTL